MLDPAPTDMSLTQKRPWTLFGDNKSEYSISSSGRIGRTGGQTSKTVTEGTKWPDLGTPDEALVWNGRGCFVTEKSVWGPPCCSDCLWPTRGPHSCVFSVVVIITSTCKRCIDMIFYMVVDSSLHPSIHFLSESGFRELFIHLSVLHQLQCLYLYQLNTSHTFYSITLSQKKKKNFLNQFNQLKSTKKPHQALFLFKMIF